MINLESNYDKMNKQKLEAFIYSHHCGNIFQSPPMYEIYRDTVNSKPYYIIATEKSEILGVVLAIILFEGNGIKGTLSRRCIIVGGPLVLNDDKDIQRLLLKYLDLMTAKDTIYLQIRNLFDMSTYQESFFGLGWRYDEHLNIIIDLSRTQEDLWRDIDPKRRNEIRRAEKEGTTVEVLNDVNQFKETYEILKEVYKRAKLPLPCLNYFEKAIHILKNNFIVFIAKNEGKIIGTMYTLCYKEVIYDWYAGSFQSCYKKYPNDLLPWKVFLWGKLNGYRTFDFGGAGKPGVPYGVRDYKKKIWWKACELWEIRKDQ